MRAIIKNKKIMLSVLALALVLTATIGTTLAYFTTYTFAEGRRPISLGAETEIEEEISGLDKLITIHNKEGSNDVYVRVKVYYGSEVSVDVKPGDKWIKGDDGWWYYDGILKADERTSVLKAEVTVPEGADPDSFEIIVVHESIQAFNPNVKAQDADWSSSFITSNKEEGGEQ